MGNVQMEAEQIRYKGSSYKNLQTAVDAALEGGGGSSTLAGLTDTAITTPSNGQVLTYDGTAEKWENAAIPAQSINGLSDAAITTPTNGQVLTYDGTAEKWKNADVAAGGIEFSTTAKQIGKWGNDDLYAVLVDGGTMSGATLDIDYTLPPGATMRLLTGYGVTANAFIPLSFVNTAQVANSIAIYYDSENSKIKIVSGASEAGTAITAIVLYSIAANNR